VDVVFSKHRYAYSHSLKIEGCKRHNIGSEAYFAKTAILWFMRDKIATVGIARTLGETPVAKKDLYMPSKEIVSYWRMVVTNEPTDIDKVGCDGMYIKEFAPSASPNTARDEICRCVPVYPKIAVEGLIKMGFPFCPRCGGKLSPVA